ncbi:hypothetical protein, partial [Trichormus variabilis]|uniref:hypothetical protein n=1 Tax=Anabaena variabilis TaxID=264691 RepID=UPI001A90D156
MSHISSIKIKAAKPNFYAINPGDTCFSPMLRHYLYIFYMYMLKKYALQLEFIKYILCIEYI